MRIWGRVDRAVIRELRGPLVLGLTGFSAVMLLNFLFLLARMAIRLRLSASILGNSVLLALPPILLFTIPMAVLLAVLVGIGRLATQGEMIALRAATVSPWRVYRPVFLTSLVLAGVSFISAEYLKPLSDTRLDEVTRDALRTQDMNREIDPGIFYDRLPGAVLYARSAAESAQGRLFQGVLLYRESPDGQLIDLLVAKRGRASLDRQTGQRALLLDQGEWHILKPSQPDSYHVVHFEENTLPFPADPSLLAADSGNENPGKMPMGQLREYRVKVAEKLKNSKERGEQVAYTFRVRKAGIEWHRRISLPCAAIGLAFLAFPISARSRRGGRFAGLSQAVVIIFVFWMAYAMGLTLSEQGRIPVWVGPWIPFGLAIAWGAVLWARLPGAERGIERRGPVELLVGAWSRLRRRREAAVAAVTEAVPAAAQNGHAGTRRMRRIAPERLDLFLGSGYLKMFGVVLAVLYILFLVVSFKNALDDVDHQAAHFPFKDVIDYLFLSTPAQLRFIVPMAALFGAAISLSALARRGEVVALKAAGIGPVRIALPLISATIAIGAAYAAVQESFLPAAERESQHALDRIRGRTAGPELLEAGRRWIAGEDGHIWNYVDFDARRQLLLSPEVVSVDFENAHVLARMFARTARRSATNWVFDQGWRRTFHQDGTESFETLATTALPFAESAELFGAARSRLMLGDDLTEQSTFMQLLTNIRRSGRAGYPAAPLVVGLNEKLVYPVLPIVLVLVGVPLAVSGWQRKGSLYGFGLSLLVIFSFFVMHAVSTSLGREGVLQPVVATWAPTVLIALYGTVTLVRAR